MDTSEVRNRKKALAREIGNLIAGFEKETGMQVTEVDLGRSVSVSVDGTVVLTSPEVRITVEI